MAWSTARVMRETHFVAALTLGLILMFYATSGLIADNRDWLGHKDDRDDIANERPFGGDLRCDADVLRDAVAAAMPGVAQGEAVMREGWAWLSLDGDRQRAVCHGGHDEWYLGRVEPVPAGMPAKGTGRTQWIRNHLGGRRVNDVEADLAGTVARVRSTWSLTTVAVDDDAQVWTVFDNRLSWKTVVVDVHKGNGRGDWLVEITFVLSAITAFTGVAHGLRFKGRRRRILIAVMLAAVALLGVMLAP